MPKEPEVSTTIWTRAHQGIETLLKPRSLRIGHQATLDTVRLVPGMLVPDLPLSACARLAIALPIFAACVVSFWTSAWYRLPDNPAALWPALSRLVPELNSCEATCEIIPAR